MKLEFDNINEIFDFLKDIGYVVNKKEDSIEDIEIGKGKTLEYDWDEKEGLKEKNKKWGNPFIPYYPTTPAYPQYPNYPIVTMCEHSEKAPEIDPNKTNL